MSRLGKSLPRLSLVSALLLSGGTGWPAPPAGEQPLDQARFDSTFKAFFAQNCFLCHNAKLKTADLNLQSFTNPSSLSQDRNKWEAIVRKLEAGEMPPKGMPRPKAEDVKAVTELIGKEFDRLDASVAPDPGRVTARRLNRAEYNNTVRDLLGVDAHPANDFPQDDSGYGFDNIGDALSLSPVLMEKYLASAETIAQAALFGPANSKPTVTRHQPLSRGGIDGGDPKRFALTLPYTTTDYDLTGLSLPSAIHVMHAFPAEADYDFRISPEGNRPVPSDTFNIVLWIDGKPSKTIPLDAATGGTGMEGQDRTVRLRVPAGDHSIEVSALREFEGLPSKYGGLNPTKKPPLPPREFSSFAKLSADATPEQKAEYEQNKAAFEARQKKPKTYKITDMSFRINYVEITGPFHPVLGPDPKTSRLLYTCGHLDGHHNPSCARKILADLEHRAYRRPPTPQEVDHVLALVSEDRKRGDSFNESLAVGIEAVLVSPQFLFRIETDPQPGQGEPEHQISQNELASRLSYFLWSSMPDAQLLRCAEQGTLRKPEVLNQQVTRMLRDPKAHALVENFGGQWLEFRALESVNPDRERFPFFDDYIRTSMQKETELFIENIIHEDRPVLDFLDAKYSFMNEALARFYGIPGVSGPEFRKVDLSGTERSGIITQGSIMTVSSYSTRTSVVLRGKWVLENILNAPVPPPPPNVPPLDESAVGTSMSLRQQMEKHRANAVCASCHSRMDPLGFGLENYDAIGHWRTQDGKFPIDSSGQLPNGRTFNGPDELKAILSGNRAAFANCITEKLLIYALGRGLERYDKPTLKKIVGDVTASDYRFSSLVLGIVNSLPFQERKGDRNTNVHHA